MYLIYIYYFYLSLYFSTQTFLDFIPKYTKYNKKEIEVYFTNTDKSFSEKISGITTNNFVRLEEKFYKNHPEYKNNEKIYYISNGRKIKRFSNLFENNINNGDEIILLDNTKSYSTI